jgi:hypothetical protein
MNCFKDRPRWLEYLEQKKWTKNMRLFEGVEEQSIRDQDDILLIKTFNLLY